MFPVSATASGLQQPLPTLMTQIHCHTWPINETLPELPLLVTMIVFVVPVSFCCSAQVEQIIWILLCIECSDAWE